MIKEKKTNRAPEFGPNDLKLSDCPARRDGCAGEGGGAAGVTRGAVRSSAWLGVAVIWVESLRRKKTPHEIPDASGDRDNEGGGEGGIRNRTDKEERGEGKESNNECKPMSDATPRDEVADSSRNKENRDKENNFGHRSFTGSA